VSKVKFFLSQKGLQGGADLRFLSPQPDTSLHCETTNTGLVYRAACLFTPQLGDGSPVCRRSPIQVLTGPSIE